MVDAIAFRRSKNGLAFLFDIRDEQGKIASVGSSNGRARIEPSQNLFVFRDRHGKKTVDTLSWGRYVNNPFYAFAHEEELMDETSFWFNAFQFRRCLIPADGWYANLKNDSKLPHFSQYKDKRCFMIAGIWGYGMVGGNKKECVILVLKETPPEYSRQFSHMPAIVQQKDWSEYAHSNTSTLKAFQCLDNNCDDIEFHFQFDSSEEDLYWPTTQRHTPSLYAGR